MRFITVLTIFFLPLTVLAGPVYLNPPAPGVPQCGKHHYKCQLDAKSGHYLCELAKK